MLMAEIFVAFCSCDHRRHQLGYGALGHVPLELELARVHAGASTP